MVVTNEVKGSEVDELETGVATITVPALPPLGETVDSTVRPVIVSLPVYGTVVVTYDTGGSSELDAGMAKTMVPATVPLGGTVETGTGPVMESVPEYKTVVVTYDGDTSELLLMLLLLLDPGVATMTVPSMLPLGGMVVNVVAPVMGSLPV